MSIVQLGTFDVDAAIPWQIMSSHGFWASLPRLASGLPVAKLLLIADTLKVEAVKAGFEAVAVPDEALPPSVRLYRMQYDDFLRQEVEDTRYTRVYLSVNTTLSENGLCDLLGAYGLRTQALAHQLPLPFEQARSEWDHVVSDVDGRCYALLRSKVAQNGSLNTRALHRLFTLPFPVWAALNIYTFSEAEAQKRLRSKVMVARFGAHKNLEEAQEAADVENTAARFRAEMNRSGGLLHTVRLYVMVSGADPKELNTHVEVARGSMPFDMQRVFGPGEMMRQVFSAAPIPDSEGTALTSPGVALLTGSALSYHRRTETKGVLLGIDRNQSPVVVNLFDPRNSSYNMVVLGQSGRGKTFAVLTLMLRGLMLGNRLVVVDPQGNVELDFLGPDVYHKSVLGTESAAINILDINQDQIGMQVEAVCSMLSLIGVFRQGDAITRALLDEVLIDIYAPIWGKNSPSPTLAAVRQRLEMMAVSAQMITVRESAQRLAYSLIPYTTGSYASLFNRPSTADFSLNSPVTVYDVSRLPKSELGGNLRSALLAILVGNVNQAIRLRRRAGDTTPIQFFVDEMGILMRDEVIAGHVSAEYKTARARNVGMIVADQDLHSLLGPADASGLHHGAPILANADFNLLFYQKGSERQRIRESFPDLPPALLETVFTLPRGVCLAKLGDEIAVVHVRPSVFEQIVLSSRLPDRERARAMMRRMMEEMP
jgi:hypothetical protein